MKNPHDAGREYLVREGLGVGRATPAGGVVVRASVLRDSEVQGGSHGTNRLFSDRTPVHCVVPMQFWVREYVPLSSSPRKSLSGRRAWKGQLATLRRCAGATFFKQTEG